MNAPTLNLKGDADDAFRASVVGASEVAALFDASPWVTHFELWHRKNGTVATPEFGGNERIEWGIRLERPIIEAAVDRFGYKLLDTPRRLDNGKGLGGHPDQIAMCPRRGRGILEVKMADWLVAKRWGDEPPLHYLLQNMAYQGLAQCDWGDVIVLVGGNELRRYEYQFRPVIYADIEARVASFWQTVREGKPPKADYTRDGATLSQIYDPSDTLIDLRRDNRMPEVLQEYLDAKAAETAAAARLDAAKAEIMEKLGENAAALVDGYSCRVPVVAGKPDTIITAEMVGQVIKGRAAHRRFYIKEMAA